MKKLVGLLSALILTCVILSASPVSAGTPYCWFNKWIWKCGDGWVKAPTTVTTTVGTDEYWQIRITVSVPVGWVGDITGVTVTDRFGAEIEIEEPFPVSITHGTVSYTTKGKSAKVFLTWEIGTLSPGDWAALVIKVSTDLNPAGHQEYTSPNCYELNSGAVLKFFDMYGKQHSAYTDSIMVEVT